MTMNRILRTVLMVTLSMALAVGMWAGMPAQRVAADAAEDDVVINEFAINPSTANGKEYVELLVVTPGGVNMQGWTLSDVGTRAGSTGTTEGDVTLPASAAYLSNVPQGTYVVIVFTTPTANTHTLAEDVSLTDGNNRLVLIIGTTTGLVTAGTIDNATNDNLQLYAGTRASGTLIDQVLCGTNTSYIADATWGDNNPSTPEDNVNGGTTLPANSAVRFVPTANTLAGFRDNDAGARFVVEGNTTTPYYGTPGTTNKDVADDSAVTNPTYTTGTVPAGSYIGLTIAGNVNSVGDLSVYKNGLTVVNTGILDLGSYSLSIPDSNGFITNNGTLRQTRDVNGSADVNFFNVGGYGGLTLNASGSDLGSTVVSIKGNQACDINNTAVNRCFDIAPANATGRNATITFYYNSAELNSLDCATMNAWHWSGALPWVQAGTSGTRQCATNPYSLQVTGVTTFSPFALRSGTAGPTSVGSVALSGSASWLPIGMLLLTGFVVLRKRK